MYGLPKHYYGLLMFDEATNQNVAHKLHVCVYYLHVLGIVWSLPETIMLVVFCYLQHFQHFMTQDCFVVYDA